MPTRSEENAFTCARAWGEGRGVNQIILTIVQEAKGYSNSAYID